MCSHLHSPSPCDHACPILLSLGTCVSDCCQVVYQSSVIYLNTSQISTGLNYQQKADDWWCRGRGEENRHYYYKDSPVPAVYVSWASQWINEMTEVLVGLADSAGIASIVLLGPGASSLILSVSPVDEHQDCSFLHVRLLEAGFKTAFWWRTLHGIRPISK